MAWLRRLAAAVSLLLSTWTLEMSKPMSVGARMTWSGLKPRNVAFTDTSAGNRNISYTQVCSLQYLV